MVWQISQIIISTLESRRSWLVLMFLCQVEHVSGGHGRLSFWSTSYHCGEWSVNAWSMQKPYLNVCDSVLDKGKLVGKMWKFGTCMHLFIHCTYISATRELWASFLEENHKIPNLSTFIDLIEYNWYRVKGEVTCRTPVTSKK